MSMGTGTEDEVQHCPRGLVWQGMDRDLPRMPKRGGDVIVTVKLMHIFCWISTKCLPKCKGLKGFMSHPYVYQSYGPVKLKVLGHFPEMINTYRAKSFILRSGQRWSRQRGQETLLRKGKCIRESAGKDWVIQINWFPF